MEEMKKPILPTIREMEVDEVQSWPIERYDTVRISMNRANLMMRPEGRKYSMRTKGLTVEVVRLA
jgi:hypothetical protein